MPNPLGAGSGGSRFDGTGLRRRQHVSDRYHRDMIRLLLIRHGETELGDDHLYPEHGGLTELGRRQAEATARRLANEPIDQILSSNVRRAFETAEPLARTKGVPVTRFPGFDEVRIGQLRSAPIEAIVERIHRGRPRADFAEFDGENPASFSERVLHTLSIEVMDRFGGDSRHQSTLALFAHGGTLSVILDYAEGIRFQGDLYRQIPNGSIAEVGIERRTVRVLRQPNASHLEKVGITQMHGSASRP